MKLPPEYEEIHEDAHVRCNVVDGKCADFITIREWNEWQKRTHEIVTFRNRITGAFVGVARQIPVLSNSHPCCP